MVPRRTLFLLSGLIAAALGCSTSNGETTTGTGSGGGGTGGGEPAVNDVRVAVPEPDPAFIDIVTPEAEIEPGVEKMFCYYLTNEEGDFAVTELQAMQGEYGHHVTLLTTLKPEPTGTWQDCTANEFMPNFRSFVFPDTPLPEGYGIRVPDKLQYVMQIHYVNAGTKPLLVRDVARLRKVPVESVTTWVSTLTTNHLAFKVPALEESTVSFDCVIPTDVEVLVLGGHMHERGTMFDALIGSDEASMKSAYYVDPWKPEYRDAPPVSLFFSNPMKIAKGTNVRTTCSWKNTEAKEIGFPDEMCSTFAYLAGTAEPLHCEVK